MSRHAVDFGKPFLPVGSVFALIAVAVGTCVLVNCSGAVGTAPGTPLNPPGSSIQGVPPAPPAPTPGAPTPSSGTTPPSSGGNGGSGGGGGSGTGGGSSAATQQFLYVVETGPATDVPEGFIEAFQVNGATGILTPVAGSPFATNHSTESIAMSPNGTSGYVVANDFVNNNFNNVLLVYAFTNGVPTLRQTLMLGIGIGGFAAVDPSGKFVYVSVDSNDPATSGIALFTAQGDGTLVQSPVLTHTDVNPGRITMDSHGRFLYTDTETTNRIWGFRIDSTTGALTAVRNSPVSLTRTVPQAGKEPITLNALLSPAGQRLFVIDSVNSNILVYAVDQTSGELMQLPGRTGPVNNFELFAPAMDPQGRFLYVGAFNTNQITGFSLTGILSSAELVLLPGLPVSTSGAPNRAMTLDTSGSFLYSVEDNATGNNGKLDAYRLDAASGSLTPVASTPITLAGSPFTAVSAP